MRYARPNVVRPSRTASSAGGEIDLSEIDVATVLSRLTRRDRERLRMAWAQMTHHEAEAESAEARGHYAQATEHWGQAATLSEWLETALAEILESAESTAVASAHPGAYPRTPTPPLGEVDFELPESMGLTPYEELLELALRVFSASDRGDSYYDLADIRSAAMRGVAPGATPDEFRLEAMGDAYELVQLPGGTLWERVNMAPDDPNLPWDSVRRTVRSAYGDEPGDYYDVWVLYTHTDGSPRTHERAALGPLTVYARGGRPAPAEVMWAHRIGREVRRILGAAGSPLVGQRDITDQRAVDALWDLYASRDEFRRRHQERQMRKNGTRRPTAKIEAAVEATRVWLGSVDRVRVRDEAKLEARALRAIDAVAAHYGVDRAVIFDQLVNEARGRGLRLARPGQDV